MEEDNTRTARTSWLGMLKSHDDLKKCFINKSKQPHTSLIVGKLPVRWPHSYCILTM
jgi:hypothetical protein